MTFSKVLKNLERSIRKHSPEILTGIGIAGMITTTVMSVRVTPKALILIEERRRGDRDTELSPIDIVKTVWRCYIPAAVTGTVSIICLIGASSVNFRRNAAIATAYSLSETALKEYQEKVIEAIGERKEEAVRGAIAKDKLDKNPVVTSEVIITNAGRARCYDVFSDRYFDFDIDMLKRIENELNRRMMTEIYISLNDFYYEVGLKNVPCGDDLGWNISDGFIDMKFSSQLASDNVPCLVIDYKLAPRYDYRDR